jgi:nitroimidazol reductase NimA-like FMN-containing flavoprotein (pyridoxamine 5'-phosphate oxidase superfamily)
MLRELSVDECIGFLRRHRIGRLAVRDAEGAYIVPISYAYGDGSIYGHAAPGKKVQLARRWPHVAFQVDEVWNPATWVSVLVQGRWHELDREEDRFRARTLLLQAFEGSLMSATAGHGHRTTLAEAILFRIDIETVSGRAENA